MASQQPGGMAPSQRWDKQTGRMAMLRPAMRPGRVREPGSASSYLEPHQGVALLAGPDIGQGDVAARGYLRYQPLDATEKNGYVAPGWTDAELRRMTRYYSRLRWLEHIPYEDYQAEMPLWQGAPQ